MDLGLYIAASGMVAEQVRQDQLANDLANTSTPGYKPDESSQHSFGEVLIASTRGGPVAGSMNMGVELGKAHSDMAVGSIRNTGQPLDFAIEGAGFFAVQTTQGMRYTRDGQFSASAQGVLIDTNGNPVLDQGGKPVKVPGGGELQASALGVFAVPDATKQGENLYTGTAGSGATGQVRQGALEGSGVDAAKVMVDMITSLRTFQSGQQAIQAIGQTLQQASTQVGSINVPG